MALKPPDLYARPPAAGPAMRPAAPLRPPRLSTERLMGGRREIVLQHGLEEYRLRITSAGKLILTK
jgi:hemin uptake protein HemP